MDPAVLSAIITSGAAVGSAAASGIAQSNLNSINRDFNAHQAKLQREWSEQMAIQQNQWNKELWNMENEYNTPVNQVKRLYEAGLNPLYFGLDGNSAGSAPEAAQPLSYERASIGNQVNPVESGLAAAAHIAQIGNIQADTAKKLNENLTETQKRENMIAELANIKQELQNKLSQQGLTDAQKDSVLKSLSWIDRLNEATVGLSESNKKLNDSQRRRIDELLSGEKILQSKSIEDFNRRWSKIESEISKMSEETGLLKKDIENYALNHSGNGFFGSGVSIPNFIRWLIWVGDMAGDEEFLKNTTPPPTYPGP